VNTNQSLSSCQEISAKATDFVKLVYDSPLLQFMGKVSCGILIEDGALVHCSRLPKEWRKLSLIG
jgi:hypothetical protein